jgi:hypothetical protein
VLGCLPRWQDAIADDVIWEKVVRNEFANLTFISDDLMKQVQV